MPATDAEDLLVLHVEHVAASYKIPLPAESLQDNVGPGVFG